MTITSRVNTRETPDPRRLWDNRADLLGVVLFGVAVLAIAVLATRSFLAGPHAWDALTYLAAGERLNIGHPLYALSPGDRLVELRPPYWSNPLLYPPPIAVIWRPLAALPHDLGISVWWIPEIVIIGATVFLTARQAILPAGLALLILFPSFVGELEVGNVNGYLLGGTVLVWMLARGGRDTSAGASIALMAGIKLWPFVLLFWFIGQHRWGVLRGFGVGVAAVAALSLLGAGVGAHLDYIGIAASTPPSAMSVAGILSVFGLSLPSVGFAIVLFGLAEVLALRHRPELAFSVAVATMILGSPVVNPNTFMVLFACVAPFAWRLDSASNEGRTAIRFGSTYAEPA